MELGHSPFTDAEVAHRVLAVHDMWKLWLTEVNTPPHLNAIRSAQGMSGSPFLTALQCMLWDAKKLLRVSESEISAVTNQCIAALRYQIGTFAVPGALECLPEHQANFQDPFFSIEAVAAYDTIEADDFHVAALKDNEAKALLADKIPLLRKLLGTARQGNAAPELSTDR